MNTSMTWKPVKGFEHLYMISSNGVVMSNNQYLKNKKGKKRFRIGKTIKVFIDKRSGYPIVKLSDNSKDTSRFIHRLVAEAFIDNPGGKKCVNHINGNKLDFSIKNLEWVTASENRIHALSTGLARPPFQKARVIDICTGMEHDSIYAASQFHKVKYFICKQMLKGHLFNDTCLRLAQ